MMTNAGDEARLDSTDSGEWTLRDEEARQYVRDAAEATVSLVESTFGPAGMEKLVETEDLQGGDELRRLGDAGRLLDAIERGDGFSHPVAALFVDSADGMRSRFNDGTTTAILMAGALLSEGFDLVEDGLAPSSVVVGYSIAQARAGEVLDDLARPIDPDDEALLADVAATTMTTNLESETRDTLAHRVAGVVSALADARDDGWVNTDHAKVLANPGTEAEVIDGLVLSRPEDADPTGRGIGSPLTDATVAMIDREIDFEETASVLDGGEGVTLSSYDAAEQYQSQLLERVQSAAASLADQDVDVIISLEKLDERVVRSFEEAGIAVVDKATYPKEDVYRLAEATGGTVVSNLHDLTEDRLGHADRVTERDVGGETWTVFEGCSGPVKTIVAGGRTASEARRREDALEDALETTAVAVIDGQVLPGAGAPAAAVAAAIRDEVTSVSGHEQLAVERFADAVERIPAALARNAGHDPVTVISALRTAHATEDKAIAGVDPDAEEPMDVWERGVVEPRRVFSQAIETGGAVVEQLLMIDTVFYPNVQLPGYTPRPEGE